jgi:hypothetical protein
MFINTAGWDVVWINKKPTGDVPAKTVLVLVQKLEQSCGLWR